jgi:hypothetical protein
MCYTYIKLFKIRRNPLMQKDAPSFNLAMNSMNVRLEQFIPLFNMWSSMTPNERSISIDYHYKHTKLSLRIEEWKEGEDEETDL